MENRLDGLPHIKHTAAHISSLKVKFLHFSTTLYCRKAVYVRGELTFIFPLSVYLMSPQMNESLSQLFVYTQSFRLHVDWLKTAKLNVSLSSQSAEGASSHLLKLSNLVNTSLHQVRRPARFDTSTWIIWTIIILYYYIVIF